jgi:hypothetical protein
MRKRREKGKKKEDGSSSDRSREDKEWQAAIVSMHNIIIPAVFPDPV